MATTVQASLLHEARGLLDDVIALRRRIHRHPEIGLTLPRRQQTVLEALDGLGLAIRTGEKTTSVVATLEGGRPGRTMLLRADMDALPLTEDTGLPFASEVDGFSYVLQRVTGAFAFLGTRPAEGPAPPNHSNRMLVNEDALPAGVAMHVAVALDFLNGH